MANYTINNLTELTGAVAADYVAVWDVSAGTTRKVTLTNIFSAVLAAANEFTATQTFAPISTGSSAAITNLPTGSSAYYHDYKINSTSTLLLVPASNATHPGGAIIQQDYDAGNNAKGPFVFIGRNTNATKPGAGFLRVNNRAGTSYRIWADSSGNLRIHTADPIYDNDALGTVIGTQTSMAEAKNLLGDVGEPIEALRAIVEAAKFGLKRFDYKSGAFRGENFEGIITDLAPRYGMDRDADHPAGKSLNEIQLFGDLIRSVALIAERLGIVNSPSDNK